MANFYPSILELLPAHLLPGDDFDLAQITAPVLGKIYYSDFIVEVSKNGEHSYYTLTLGGNQNSVEIPIPGTGLTIKLSGEPELMLDVTWQILRYIKGFSVEGFSYTEKAFFDLLYNIGGLTKEVLLEEITRTFLPVADPIDALITELTDLSLPSGLQNVSEIVSYAKANNLDLLASVFENIIKDAASPEETLRNLEILFRRWIGDFSIDSIKKILLPQLDFQTGEMGISIVFPRSILIPLDGQGQIIPEGQPNDQSELTFTSASFRYQSGIGFEFQVDSGGASLGLSQIGNTGLCLSVTDVQLDLSRKKNIGPAQNLPNDFIGVFVRQATITLPEEWFGQDDVTLSIFGRNLLIGTGGISGTIGMGAVATEVAALSEVIGLHNGPDIRFLKQGTDVQVGDPVVYESDHERVLTDGTYTLASNAGEILVKNGKLLNFLPANAEMLFTLGKKDNAGNRKGFQIGFHHFHMTWQQNSLIESSVQGSLTIPKFKQCIYNTATEQWESQAAELKINIEAFFEQDGDFKIAAKPAGGLSFCLQNVFIVTIKDLAVGKDDGQVYLELSGSISFENNAALSKLLSAPLEVKKLRIYQDGTFEIEGGSIPLPDSVGIKVGPTEVFITAIHFGSHEQEHDGELRRYKYIGLDGGINVNPGGVDASGKGIKYYFTIDDEEDTNDDGVIDINRDHHSFLKLESLAINLTIPGDVSDDKAVLLAQGFLALKEHEYIGSIKFQLPKVKIAGGAGMRYNKKYPAFLIDVFLELATGIPLAQTGLAIFGFRGLFGLRYIAAKDAVDPAANTWVEYYQADPEKGIHVAKFKTPDGTAGAKNPISIGAGISLATQADDGKAFSSQLFLLLSLRNLIILEGKANVMGERVGITEGDPPFFAMLVLDLNESVQIGMGADYKLPQTGDNAGKILVLKAEVNAAFYFKNKKAWFVHLGTKAKPVTARILDLFNCYSYLMISPKELETGAGVQFGFDKKYAGGVVKASVNVYFDIWGRIGFQDTQIGGSKSLQIGGGIACGGAVSASLFGFGFYLGINTLLTAEVPEPFKIYGEVELCIAVKLLVKKVEKCFKVNFTWERKPAPGAQPIYVMPTGASASEMPVKAIHMISGKVYDIHYFGTSAPAHGQIDKVIPLDTWVEIQFEHSLKAGSAIHAKIGGYSNGAESFAELIPPTKGDRQERHEYTLEAIDLEYWDGANWQTYHPYKALDANNHITNIEDYKIGYWQKNGREYNKIRLLAQTPFTYTEEGQDAWYVPEQMGLTANDLYCEGTKRVKKCVNWTESDVLRYDKNKMHQHEGLAFRIAGSDGFVKYQPTQRATIYKKLCFENGAALEIYFPDPVLEVDLKLGTTHQSGLTVSYYKEIWTEINGLDTKQWQLLKSVSHPRSALGNPIEYKHTDPDISITEDPDWDDTTLTYAKAVNKIVIQSQTCSETELEHMERQLLQLQDQYYQETDPNRKEELKMEIESLKAAIYRLKSQCCTPLSEPGGNDIWTQILEWIQQKEELEAYLAENCQPGQAGADPETCERKKIELEQVTGKINEIINNAEAYEERPIRYDCQTCLFQVCWLTLEDYAYNVNIPAQDALDTDYQLMQDAIQKTIAPIWQPYTTYRAKVTVKDNYKSYSGASNNSSASFYLGFKTDGSLGHFDEAHIVEEAEVANQPALPAGLDAPGKEAPENALKYYIDYEKSYPFADGDLLYAKPLYYLDPYPSVSPAGSGSGGSDKPRLLLFFKKNYAYHFFGTWSLYASPAHTFEQVIEIIDPLETSDNLSTSVDVKVETVSVKEFFGDDAVDNTTQVLNNLLNASCRSGAATPIDPQDHYLDIRMDNLKPLKLYAAIIKNKQGSNARAVHNYNFKTSRYPNFQAHMDSYNYRNEDGAVVKRAIFDLKWPLTNDHIQSTRAIVNGQALTISPFDEFEKVYTDDFDRLFVGVFDIRAFPPPVATEINIVRKANGEAIGLWVRSPEPFNNPRMPRAELDATVEVLLNNSNTGSNSYKQVFSKDLTQVFIMRNNGAVIESKKLRLRFRYLEWDGREYVVMDEYITSPMTFAKKTPGGGISIGQPIKGGGLKPGGNINIINLPKKGKK